MYRVSTTGKQIGERLARAVAALPAGLLAGLRLAAITINRLALDNLAGSHKAKPGSYPVPNRTGNLFRHQNWEPATGSLAMFVFNDARYAKAIHDGEDSSKRYGPRRFLEDAADQSRYLDDVQVGMQGSLFG